MHLHVVFVAPGFVRASSRKGEEPDDVGDPVCPEHEHDEDEEEVAEHM